MVVTAREFAARRAGINIEWEARSLYEFGDASAAALVSRYDMVVIDHPFMGEVARDRYLLPLDELLPRETLDTLADESVGASHRSYFYDGHQWALAIDAAAQVSGYRPDLLERVPTTWREVIELAKSTPRGFVTPALLPVDSMMCFFSLCAAAGEPFPAPGESAERALHALKVLAEHSAEDALSMNPITVWERMSSTDDIAYCPLAFGYSNYARPGYRRSLVAFTNAPAGGNGATLGGAGLAITASCQDIEAAAEYAAWVAGAECQRTLYVQSGGQPGNRRAWTDPDAIDYFPNTLYTLEHAFVRPRYAGFVEFQTAAAHAVTAFLRGNETPSNTLQTIHELYGRSRPPG